jgi:hypothetical protein
MLTPNDLESYLVLENCQRIRVEDYIRTARKSLKKAIVEAQITASGYKVVLTTSKTHYGGERLWFRCPQCYKRCGILYQSPIASRVVCRKCIGFFYRQQRFKGMQ